MRNGQNTTNKNNNTTIATIAHDGAFVAIAVQIGITTCSLSNAYDSYRLRFRHRLLSPPETGWSTTQWGGGGLEQKCE